MDILDEMYKAYRKAYGEKGDEPNSIIIPLNARKEIEENALNYKKPGVNTELDGTRFAFGCKIIFADISEIKAGYLV